MSNLGQIEKQSSPASCFVLTVKLRYSFFTRAATGSKPAHYRRVEMLPFSFCLAWQDDLSFQQSSLFANRFICQIKPLILMRFCLLELMAPSRYCAIFHMSWFSAWIILLKTMSFNIADEKSTDSLVNCSWALPLWYKVCCTTRCDMNVKISGPFQAIIKQAIA